MYDRWRKDMDEAGLDSSLGVPQPILGEVVVTASYKVVGEGDNAILTIDRHVGDVQLGEWIENVGLPERLIGESPWEEYVLSEDEASGILEEFIALADAPNEQFVYFADKYRALQLCDKHGLPSSHAMQHPMPLLIPGQRNNICSTTIDEPIKHWRWLARLVGAIVQIAAAIHWSEQNPELKPKLGTYEDWASFIYPHPEKFRMGVEAWDSVEEEAGIEDRYDPEPHTLEEAKWMLVAKINSIMEWGEVRLHLVWTENGPQMRFGGIGAWGRIVAQLYFFVMQRRIAACSECGKVYTWKRKPARGKDNYCPECGHRASSRNAMRRLRSKEP